MMANQFTVLFSFVLLMPAGRHYDSPARCPGLVSRSPLTITFTISNAGFDVAGTIGVEHTQIEFDPNHLESSSVTVSASPATIHTGIALRDRHLQKADFFDTEKYPLIIMRSRSFRKAGNKKLAGNFDLTIKGITRPIQFIFTGRPEGKGMRYKGQLQINRRDFDLGDASIILDDLVEVDVEVVL